MLGVARRYPGAPRRSAAAAAVSPCSGMARLWDAHTHLHLHPAPAAALSRALSAGLTDLVVCATRPSDWPAVLALCAAAPGALIPSLGVHPYHAAAAGPPHTWLPALEAALDAAAAAAPRLGIGECGLDLSPRALAANPLPVQLAALQAQLALAAARGLAVSLHCVRAQKELLGALQQAAAAAAPGSPRAGLPRGLLLHSWGGRPADARRLQALGVPCVFSFAGGLVGAAARALGAAGGARTPACASRDCLASWAALPGAVRALETDAPDQGFQRSVTQALRAAWAGGGQETGEGGLAAAAGAAAEPVIGEGGAAGAGGAAAGSCGGSSAAAGAAVAAQCCGGGGGVGGGDAERAAGEGGAEAAAAAAAVEAEEPNEPAHVLQVAAAGALLQHGASGFTPALGLACARGANEALDALFPRRH